MKKLTRIQAWTKIKQSFEVFNESDVLTTYGLCFAIRRLLKERE